MNGSAQNYQSSPDLPAPHQEGLSFAGSEQPAMPINRSEVAGKQSELPTAGAPINAVPAMPFGPAPTTPPPIPPAPLQGLTLQIPVNDAPPTVANDSDLIEKEWVSKAKYIVETTREDPHLQNKELGKFKADYVQKRFNKQLKISDQ